MVKSEQVAASNQKSIGPIGHRQETGPDRPEPRSIVSIRWKRFKHLARGPVILLGRLTGFPDPSASETTWAIEGNPAPCVPEALAG